MVRVYQPRVRFDSASDARRHRFFKRDQIDAETPEAVESMIVRGVASRSRALAADGIVVSVDDVISKQRELRLAELRQLTDDTSLREQLGIQEELLEVVDDENTNLSAKLRELQEQVEAAETDRAELEQRVASLTFEGDRLRRAATDADSRPRELQVVSRVVWKKRSGAFFRLVKCTTNRPPRQAATGETRHGQTYQEAGSGARAGTNLAG